MRRSNSLFRKQGDETSRGLCMGDPAICELIIETWTPCTPKKEHHKAGSANVKHIFQLGLPEPINHHGLSWASLFWWITSLRYAPCGFGASDKGLVLMKIKKPLLSNCAPFAQYLQDLPRGVWVRLKTPLLRIKEARSLPRVPQKILKRLLSVTCVEQVSPC